MKLLQKKEGFTLIEMMIVVVIIGILAAIAIPQFLRYQLKSKTSEAPRNLGAIRTNEEAFSAKFGAYATAAQRPAGAPGATKQTWGAIGEAGFDAIGFSPSGQVFYVYVISDTAPGTDGTFTDGTDTTFDATSGDPTPVTNLNSTVYFIAQGDVDGDTTTALFFQSNKDTKIQGSPVTAGETVF